MIYLDNGATSFHKPPQVTRAVQQAFLTCANPGRGGYEAAMTAGRQVYACREAAGNCSAAIRNRWSSHPTALTA